MTKEQFVQEVLRYLDYPSVKYRCPKQGMNVKGFDCSGFVAFLVKNIGVYSHIPRHCNEFFDSFGIFVQKYQMGDLVFFSLKNGGAWPDHMGIMISRTEYINSPGRDNTVVKISKLRQRIIKSPRCKKQVREQIYTKNPIGFKRLTKKEGRYQKILLT